MKRLLLPLFLLLGTPLHAQTFEQKTQHLRDLVQAIDEGANDAADVPISGWLTQAEKELKKILPKLSASEQARPSLAAYRSALQLYTEFQDRVYAFFGAPPADSVKQDISDKITATEKSAHAAVLLADSLLIVGK